MKRILYVLIPILAASCSSDPDVDLIPQSGEIRFEVPSNFPPPVYDFSNNEVSREKFELGRKLFYDPFLSRDGSISCESCHQQFVAFAHEDHALSHGIENRVGTRNAPALYNLAWHKGIMWDGGIENLEVQPLAPLQDHREMDIDILVLLAKLQAHSTYPTLFKSAFGNDTISLTNLLKAIAQFQGLLISSNSKYDKVVRGEGASFTVEEEEGRQIFMAKCASCHSGDLFSDFTYRNNGLDATPVDSGRARITGDPNDLMKFKVPSLRNLAVTFPYTHDGRFETIREVLDHYDGNVNPSATLDPLLQPMGIELSEQEKDKIIAFLFTLTDHEFLNDPRFSFTR